MAFNPIFVDGTDLESIGSWIHIGITDKIGRRRRIGPTTVQALHLVFILKLTLATESYSLKLKSQIVLIVDNPSVVPIQIRSFVGSKEIMSLQISPS